MLVSVVIAPLSFCSFPPHYICQRRLFFLLSFRRTSSKTYHFFSFQINDFPIFMPVEIWCLPIQGSLCPSHFTSSWCLAWGGWAGVPEGGSTELEGTSGVGWRSQESRSQRGFPFTPRTPGPRFLASGPIGWMPAVTPPQLVPESFWCCN